MTGTPRPKATPFLIRAETRAYGTGTEESLLVHDHDWASLTRAQAGLIGEAAYPKTRTKPIVIVFEVGIRRTEGHTIDLRELAVVESPSQSFTLDPLGAAPAGSVLGWGSFEGKPVRLLRSGTFLEATFPNHSLGTAPVGRTRRYLTLLAKVQGRWTEAGQVRIDLTVLPAEPLAPFAQGIPRDALELVFDLTGGGTAIDQLVPAWRQVGGISYDPSGTGIDSTAGLYVDLFFALLVRPRGGKTVRLKCDALALGYVAMCALLGEQAQQFKLDGLQANPILGCGWKDFEYPTRNGRLASHRAAERNGLVYDLSFQVDDDGPAHLEPWSEVPVDGMSHARYASALSTAISCSGTVSRHGLQRTTVASTFHRQKVLARQSLGSREFASRTKCLLEDCTEKALSKVDRDVRGLGTLEWLLHDMDAEKQSPPVAIWLGVDGVLEDLVLGPIPEIPKRGDPSPLRVALDQAWAKRW